ncbi:hypothetical protein QGM71_03535 [Virgibacillus sp. C22-A2]|uniref:Uncharacterized protein n=1 Tax=Virgibacillus tibetensis TaxID=3042313 RepID=A0ABU6KB50_9BACI|nr:hypothetical protein [Virgibacillus sp. C22-A2]
MSSEPPVFDDGEEGEVSIHGLDPPGSVWDVTRKGQYDFAGKASGSTLYTNYLITGKSSYRLEIKNIQNDTLRVDLMKRNSWIDSRVATYNLSAKSTRYTFPSGLDSSGHYYLKFYAPSEFSGNIR